MLYTLAHAWQSWKSARSIALLAVIAFAVGIGATTAIFTVVNGVMLKALPYPDGDRFVALFGGRLTEPDQVRVEHVLRICWSISAAPRASTCSAGSGWPTTT